VGSGGAGSGRADGDRDDREIGPDLAVKRRSRFGGTGAASAKDAEAEEEQVKRARTPFSAMHTGPGRALTAVYGVFALSATARAGYQLIREFDVAPVAYSLSALAAVIYIQIGRASCRERE